MSLFKVLRGDSSRISTDVTPFHDGYAYFTPDDGSFYIDINTGTTEAPNNQRSKLNAKDAETLTGATLATILSSSDIEIPTSKAVLTALAAKANANDLASKQDKITGTPGQIVGFDENGNAVAQSNQTSNVDEKISEHNTDTNAHSDIRNLINGKSDSGHNHDDKYYTETEVNNLLSQKAQVQFITWEADD